MPSRMYIEPEKEYSTELTRMLSELEDPDAKQPALSRFANLNEEERGIYMDAVKTQSKHKIDSTPFNPQDNILGQIKEEDD